MYWTAKYDRADQIVSQVQPEAKQLNARLGGAVGLQ